MRGLAGHAFVSLGANLPSRFGAAAVTLDRAIERLRRLSDAPLLVSSRWESAPLDCPPGSPSYLNAVVGLVPQDDETPLSLLRKLQDIERDFGRSRSGLRNEPRVLDLDLVCFRNEQCENADLILPHPRAHQRRFVLEPLRELTGGDFILPGRAETIEECLAGIQDQSIARVDAAPE